MGLSKSTRIKILLGIDTVFFLIELVIGYAVHSLALVADSFHMLNDVLSLLVGLWAVKVAQKQSSTTYTYGWQRAETLGALVNGVFLVALCLSIFLEAIQRFVEPQEVSQPFLVMIVGCFGLASNIVGLFLFHDHGHSHGGHSHGHSHGDSETDPLLQAEQGQSSHTHDEVADEQGNVANVLPQSRVGAWHTKSQSPESSSSRPSDATAVDESQSPATQFEYKHKHKKTRSKSRPNSGVEDIYVSPNQFRRSIIESSRLDVIEPEDNPDGEDDTGNESALTTTNSPPGHTNGKPGKSSGYGAIAHADHDAHNHAQPKGGSDGHGGGGHGHSHGDLNMQGVFLHVLGDALGNIGVIASALIIWLTPWTWRFYFDPAISLVITVIILCSAIPLCKAASRILLQAVPLGLSIEDIKEDIEDLEGVVSAHHLHVWQLSDTKLVASLHIQVGFDFKGEGSARYMKLAHSIRECLHEYGIHSSTIQPEFCLDPDHDHVNGPTGTGMDGANDRDVSPSARAAASKTASKANSVRGDADACLLECGSSCGNDKSCCPTTPVGNGKDKKDHADGSSHDHDHDH